MRITDQRYCFRVARELLLISVVIGAQLVALADTPPQLSEILARYNRAGDNEQRLDIGYEALDSYADVAAKSQVDPPDRTTLSQIKRLVLFDALGKNDYEALIGASGSTGNWLLRRNMKNDYTDDEVPRLKSEGYYLEGMSDLDFAVMGGSAYAFTTRLYRVLASGRGDSQLTREELDKLEISFLVDEQITDVSPGGDTLKFWKQMLDLSRSSYHPEKYLTKGGKALYCVEHLQTRGAALAGGPPMPFSQWTASASQTIPPFTAQYVHGGACDMDYFITHAFAKTQQTQVKTLLQAVKYLMRQAWMLQNASDNVASLPDGMTLAPDRVQRLRDEATRTEALCAAAIDQQMWENGKFAGFKLAALERAAQVCIGGHDLVCDMGWGLVWKIRRTGITPKQAVLLDEIAYDLRTVLEQRYHDGKPDWYDEVVKARTEELLQAIEEARPQLDVIIADAGARPPPDPKLAEAEIGPVAPPPIVRIELHTPKLNPPGARPGEEVTITVPCTLHGLLEDGQTGPPPLTAEQLRDMKEFSNWAWRAAHQRMQITHLLLQERKNQTMRNDEEKIYVSPYEIKEITQELKEAEESVAYWAEALGTRAPDTQAGRYKPNLRATPTLAAPEDYLKALKDTCEQATKTLDDLYAQGEELSKTADKVSKNPAAGELEVSGQIADAKRQLDALLAESKPKMERTKELLAEANKYAGWAEDARKAFSGDVDFITGKAGELETYLFDLAEQAEDSAARAQRIQNQLSDNIGLFRRCAKSVPEGDRFGLRGELVKSVRQWDQKKNKLMLKTIPDLQERAQWLSRGAWAAKSVKIALKTLTAVKYYRDMRKELDRELRMTGETKNAVVALAACGDIIAAGADYIPIPVLRQTIKDYASLLSSARDWSTGFARMLEQQRQGHGFDVTPAPVAIKTLIGRSGRPNPQFFHPDTGSFATINGLTIIGYRTQPAEETGEAWLIWAPDQADGYLQLSDGDNSDHTFKEASLIAARYQRIYKRRITAEELKDLVVKGQTVRGTFITETIKTEDVHRKGKWTLHTTSAAEYLAHALQKTQFTATELTRYRGMMERAAERLAERGFVVDEEDVRATVGPVKLQPTLTGWWDTLLPGVNATSSLWDWLSDGEKSRLDSAVTDWIEKKEKARQRVRERMWEQARDQTPASGLTLGEVRLAANHAIVWPKDKSTHDQSITPADRQFELTWKTKVPNKLHGDSSYICTASLRGYTGVRDEVELPLAAPSGEWVIIKAGNTIRLGKAADLERQWVAREVLWAGLSDDPIKAEQLEGTDRYTSIDEALDAIIEAADPGGPMSVKQIFWKWFPNNNPKQIAMITIKGKDYILHAFPDKVMLATETSGVQFGRVWYFPNDERKWLRDRGVEPYIPLNKLYLLHCTGQGTSSGYQKMDSWTLFPEAPNSQGKIKVPDPYWLGSVYITDVDQRIGPLTDSYAVALALGALAKDSEGRPVTVTVPGTGLIITPDSVPPPSEDRPPLGALAAIADAFVPEGPVAIGQREGQIKFTRFPPGYINELLYADNEFGPDDYQKRIVSYFNGISSSSDEGKKRLLEGMKVRALMSTDGSHPAVVVHPESKDWKTTGRVFDGWVVQGGSSTTANEWLRDNQNAGYKTAGGKDAPVRVAVLGPVAPSFDGRFGWDSEGDYGGANGVHLSRTEKTGETVHYAAMPGDATMQITATEHGAFQVLVRAGEGKLLDYGEVTCSRGDTFSLRLTDKGAGDMVGAGKRIAGTLYSLADETRNEKVLLSKSGQLEAGRGGKFTTFELQVTVDKPGTLKVRVATPGPFSFGQSGTACRCDRIEYLNGNERVAVGRSIEGGDWKQSPVVTTTSAKVDKPGQYILRITQAVALSPTWGDVTSAPAHDYNVVASLESFQ